MNIYFACAIVGGRLDEAVYQQFVQALLDDGHVVPTAANTGLPGFGGLETELPPSSVYARDTGWIDACDAMIAEVSTPSHGVGYEISYALERGKPVLSLYLSGVRVSKMITGNNSPGLRVVSYETIEQGISIIRKFLSKQPVSP